MDKQKVLNASGIIKIMEEHKKQGDVIKFLESFRVLNKEDAFQGMVNVIAQYYSRDLAILITKYEFTLFSRLLTLENKIDVVYDILKANSRRITLQPIKLKYVILKSSKLPNWNPKKGYYGENDAYVTCIGSSHCYRLKEVKTYLKNSVYEECICNIIADNEKIYGKIEEELKKNKLKFDFVPCRKLTKITIKPPLNFTNYASSYYSNGIKFSDNCYTFYNPNGLTLRQIIVAIMRMKPIDKICIYHYTYIESVSLEKEKDKYHVTMNVFFYE